ncbi:MAG TPA: glycosyl hydrolase family 65 protein [Mycobacteriales bacterium]|nr:glycosyl hydrolase family 65 protein [Mycobacteriales bacterium]
MSPHHAYSVEPWCLTEDSIDLDQLAQSESVFALSNGHIGLRANLDEGEPHGVPGTYLNGVFELRPLPYAEAGFGYPESGQTVINVTNGKLLRLLVDDEPFDLRYGEVQSHQRRLDFREGVLERTAEWTSPAGQTIRVRTSRLVSFTQRAIAAIHYEVEAVNDPARIVVQSGLVANEQLPPHNGDPRAAAVLDAPLHSEESTNHGARCVMVHRTEHSGQRVAAAMDHVYDCAADVHVDAESFPDSARVSFTTVLKPGQKLSVTKFVAYGWSTSRSVPALRDQVAAALTAARYAGWEGLVKEQRDYLADFWARADIEIDGDVEIQQAIRFALFHVLQASARAEERAIPAKGLTGPGYDGHSFWDTEAFVLPVLTYGVPQAVAQALRWRHSILPQAKERAAQLGLAGALFPWRTIRGEECSGYWPAGTAAFHIGAAVAAAVTRYVNATGDEEFLRRTGLELLIETARMWRSLGHHDQHGNFRIDGVTGPDEYSALADNNVYTNLMAQQNLRSAARAAERLPDVAHSFGVNAEETASWRDAARAMLIPYDEKVGVHPQAEGFLEHEMWDFDNTGPDQFPLMLHFPYFDIYRKQVCKQADLVLAMQFRGDAFTAEQKARNFAYYEAITTRDSSLSACTQAVIAAEVGHLELAFDYLAEAALVDLGDLDNNTRDGLHMASMAGAVMAVVAGFGGLRDHNDLLRFQPRLPPGLSRIAFNVGLRGCLLHVEVEPERATYSLRAGESIPIRHHGEELWVTDTKPVSRPIPHLQPAERPRQPLHCAPLERHS